MPWTPKQHRLFEAAAHSPAVSARVGIPVQTAAKMAAEGVKAPDPRRVAMVAALRAKR